MNYRDLSETQLEGLFDSPALYPIKLEPEKEKIYFCEMTSEDFVREPFHDLRVLSENSEIYVASISQLLTHYKNRLTSSTAQKYIFHTAFCGSTLLSRYLNELDDTFVYREPQVYMELAHAKHCHPHIGQDTGWQNVLMLITELLSRTDSTTSPIMKMVDNCNDIVVDLLNLNPDSVSLVLFSSLEEFLISTLKHPARRTFAVQRLNGINISKYMALANVDIAGLGEATSAACLWLSQMYQILETARHQQKQFYTLSKSDLLKRPIESLSAVVKLFGLNGSAEIIRKILASHGRVHAKSGKEFSFETNRQQDLRIKNTYQDEIHQGLQWSKTILKKQSIPMIMPNGLLIDSN